ncbi:MAG: tetratricopeptide repeat protein [Planctomycetaceae bacterium]
MSDVVVPCFRHFGWAALLLSLGLNCFGCAPAASTKNAATKAAKTADEEAESRTLRNLQNALADLQADKLGIESSPEQAVANLNEWAKGAKRIAEKNGMGWEPTRPHGLLKSLPKEWLEQVTLEQFVERDAVFLRDCLWAGQIAKLGAGNAKSDLNLVVNLFEYVVRNIDLIPIGSRDVPLGPFDVMMLGRGTVQERAWVFAELLRQRNVDSVILTPRRGTRGADEADPFLVGVLFEKDILLFDPGLGVPLPGDVAAPKSAMPRQPMTLRQATGDPELLAAVARDSGGRFSVTAAMLAASQVELVCHPQQLSSRMRHLQLGLTGEQSVIVADPLEDVADQPGLWSRVARHPAATWSADDVAIWSFPETTREAASHPTDEQMKTWINLSMSLAAPQRLMFIRGDEVSRTMGLGFTKPERTLMKLRMQHVIGHWPEAVQGYLAVQLYDVETPTTKDLERISSDGKQHQPFAIVSTMDKQFLRGLMMQPSHAHIRKLHLLAGDDACYWVAQCQFEQNRLRAVVDQCRMYGNQHSSGGWVAANQMLMATALAQQDKLKEAIRALKEFDEEAPSFAGSRVLTARWQRLLAAAE